MHIFIKMGKIIYHENPKLHSALRAYCINPTDQNNLSELRKYFQGSEEELKELKKNAHLGDLQ